MPDYSPEQLALADLLLAEMSVQKEVLHEYIEKNAAPDAIKAAQSGLTQTITKLNKVLDNEE